MSIDTLQEKIRKTKNPTMLEICPAFDELPERFEHTAAGYAAYARELLAALKDIVPAVRVSFGGFALLGAEGMDALIEVLSFAKKQGYYVAVDAPELLRVKSALQTAELLLGKDSRFPCDGLIIGGYLGSDIIKPFLTYCKKGKDIFCVVRTSNKSAPEIQDLLTGSRLVHAAAADLYYRFTGDCMGKSGYSRVAVVAGANSADSLRQLRAKYPKLFLLVDDLDYPGCNAKNCSYAFDQFGYGAVCCSGSSITQAWKNSENDGYDYASLALAAAERMKNNLNRYTTIL